MPDQSLSAIPEELQEEFRAAVPIEKLGRYLIAGTSDSTTIKFSLLGKDGTNHYFECGLKTIELLASEFRSLGNFGNGKGNNLIQSQKTIPFETAAAIALVPQGGNADGRIIFNFITPSGETLHTLLGPTLALELSSSLDIALSSIPFLPKLAKGGMQCSRLPGRDAPQEESVTYFGQKYPVDILNALGVLMIRANLLERDLTTLFTKLSGIEVEKAKALFFSSNNSKARFDMIRAVALSSNLTPTQSKTLKDLLEKANGVMLRRNHLVHGYWEFKGEKFEVGHFQPLTKPKQPVSVNASHIKELAGDFRTVGMGISIFSQSI